ncbi:cp27 [Culex quinquefasciatus]|uniref:Craniofacial development protein 1 n=1 Tax=Culex quinquefasciatus TaxID=7176 RepID=B0WW17_CULQU|nr:cp27 [Culex quinquefasciatus]|eukprot:XP_001861589.1 cp27 [Culex quinquefasciatus]
MEVEDLMDPEDEYPSDSDASDEDFRPDKEEGSASELESDDNVEDEDQENGDDDGGTKPKAGAGKKRKRTGKKVPKKKAKIVEEVPEEKETEKKGEVLDDEDEERLTDALWADFLAGSNSSSTTSSSKEPAKKDPVKAVAPVAVKPPKPAPTTTTKPETVTKIFEFAGETVEVTEPAPAAEATSSKARIETRNFGSTFVERRVGPNQHLEAGLGAVLGQLGKKNKLSVLEKTQLDWKSFKRNEGIEEELQTHNRGRDGYLERQDFLQRADLRQFEIEKNFRQSKSKR